MKCNTEVIYLTFQANTIGKCVQKLYMYDEMLTKA